MMNRTSDSRHSGLLSQLEDLRLEVERPRTISPDTSYAVELPSHAISSSDTIAGCLFENTICAAVSLKFDRGLNHKFGYVIECNDPHFNSFPVVYAVDTESAERALMVYSAVVSYVGNFYGTDWEQPQFDFHDFPRRLEVVLGPKESLVIYRVQ